MGIFLVSVPVFVEAPLVRTWPWLSLLLTLVWVAWGRYWEQQGKTVWGDVLLGFSWSWLAGSIYWGWLRWDPLFHLPVEAIGLPWVLWELSRGRHRVGNWFYLGSLLGTAITDLYFYLAGVMPYWKTIVAADPKTALTLLQEALLHIQTPWGIGMGLACGGLLTIVSVVALRSPRLHHWVFGGAVLGTLMVDSLFGLAGAF